MIPFKSKLSRFRNLENRNQAFHKLSKEDRVKEIANDVLLNYLAGRIKPQSEPEYWPDAVKYKLEEITDPIKFQQEVIKKEKKILCSVCARGALMVSRIKLGNKISSRNCYTYGREGEITEFTNDQLDDIETCYEGKGHLRYGDRTPACIASIFANVLVNGEFDVEDKTDYLKEWGVKVNPKYVYEE